MRDKKEKFISIRVTEDTVKALETIAQINYLSVSATCRMIIDKYIKGELKDEKRK